MAPILLTGLVDWHHQAWIAGRTMDRSASTGQLDVAYLTKELSPVLGGQGWSAYEQKTQQSPFLGRIRVRQAGHSKKYRQASDGMSEEEPAPQ